MISRLLEDFSREGLVDSGALGIVLVVLAGVFLLTALVAFCPLYAPFKLVL